MLIFVERRPHPAKEKADADSTIRTNMQTFFIEICLSLFFLISPYPPEFFTLHLHSVLPLFRHPDITDIFNHTKYYLYGSFTFLL